MANKRKAKAAEPLPEAEEFEGEELDGADPEDFTDDEQEEVKPAKVTVIKDGVAPGYLHSLLGLPGVPKDILDDIDVHKAWLQVQTRNMPAQSMALGHLAPDALQAFDSLGYEGHARFEIRPYFNAPDVRYFAAVLPPLSDHDDDDDGDEHGGESHAVIALIRSQDERMTRLEELVLKVAEGNADPFKQVERALNFVERITESVSGLRGSDGDAEIIKTVIEQVVPRFLPEPKED